MNLFSITNLFIIAANLPFAVFLFLTGIKKQKNVSLGCICLAALLWGVGSFKYSTTLVYEDAWFWWKIANIGSILSTVTFYFFVVSCLNLQKPKLNLVVIITAGTVIWINSFFPEIFMGELKLAFNEFYYIRKPLNRISFYGVYYFIFYFCLLFYSAILLLQRYVKSNGVERQQIIYLLIGAVIGFVGCHSCFLPVFGINVYPFLNILIAFYPLPFIYAIVKYRLIDVRIAITRVGLFIFVYTLVLGIPFWIGLRYYGSGFWLIPTSISTILATVCPFIFLFMQRRLERTLLKKERESFELLEQASSGMTTIKELQKILKLTVDLVVKLLNFKKSSIFLIDKSSDQYELRASNPIIEQKVLIDDSDSLIKRLRTKKVALVYDELKMNHDGSSETESKEIMSRMNELSAKAIMPIMIKDHLLGFLVLGERDSNGIFTRDLIGTLTVLCNQAALAIENAIFYEESEKDLTQMFQDSKQKSIGALASGVAHQFNNRYNSMSFATLMAFKVIGDRKLAELSDKEQGKIIKFLKQIQDDSIRGAEIADAILNYSKADMKPRVINFKKIVKASLEVYFLERPRIEHMFSYDYDEELLLWVNFAMLQDIIKTAVDNSVDAIKIKQNKIERGSIKEENYEPKIIIRARATNKDLRIELEDNGLGLKEDELKNKIFTPFFTTKGATKGTGMGIPMMLKLIQQCGGTMKYESEHEKWTKLIITMPLATEEQIKEDQESG